MTTYKDSIYIFECMILILRYDKQSLFSIILYLIFTLGQICLSSLDLFSFLSSYLLFQKEYCTLDDWIESIRLEINISIVKYRMNPISVRITKKKKNTGEKRNFLPDSKTFQSDIINQSWPSRLFGMKSLGEVFPNLFLVTLVFHCYLIHTKWIHHGDGEM